jgi:hypothetical protein
MAHMARVCDLSGGKRNTTDNDHAAWKMSSIRGVKKTSTSNLYLSLRVPSCSILRKSHSPTAGLARLFQSLQTGHSTSTSVASSFETHHTTNHPPISSSFSELVQHPFTLDLALLWLTILMLSQQFCWRLLHSVDSVYCCQVAGASLGPPIFPPTCSRWAIAHMNGSFSRFLPWFITVAQALLLAVSNTAVLLQSCPSLESEYVPIM